LISAIQSTTLKARIGSSRATRVSMSTGPPTIVARPQSTGETPPYSAAMPDTTSASPSRTLAATPTQKSTVMYCGTQQPVERGQVFRVHDVGRGRRERKRGSGEKNYRRRWK
jgi:hypothetical protein